MKKIKFVLALILICLVSFSCFAQIDSNDDLYDKQWPYSEGYARVMRNVDFNGFIIPLYGFIDKTGKEVIPCIYDYAEDFSCGIALVGWLSEPKYNADEVSLVLQPRYTYITKSGEELDYCFYFASSANKQKQAVLLGTPYIPYGLHYNHRLDRVKWQYKEVTISNLLLHDGQQKELGVPQFLHWSEAKENSATFADLYALNYKFPTCYVDYYYSREYEIKKTKQITDLKEHEQIIDTVSGLFEIVCQHGLSGIRSIESGKLLVPCMFGDVVYIGKDKFAVEHNEKWAIVDTSMRYLTDFTYDKIKPTGRDADVSDKEHWILVGMVESTFTYEWGYKYNYKWLSVDIEKLCDEQ